MTFHCVWTEISDFWVDALFTLKQSHWRRAIQHRFEKIISVYTTHLLEHIHWPFRCTMRTVGILHRAMTEQGSCVRTDWPNTGRCWQGRPRRFQEARAGVVCASESCFFKVDVSLLTSTLTPTLHWMRIIMEGRWLLVRSFPPSPPHRGNINQALSIALFVCYYYALVMVVALG